MSETPIYRRRLVQIGALVVLSTLVLTIGFYGVVSIFGGRTTGVFDRLPYYILGLAALFVALLLLLEDQWVDGREILLSAVTMSAIGALLLAFSAEGILFAMEQPEAVFTSDVFLYIVAAGLIATGLGYWALRHWRELASSSSSGGL